MRRWCVGASVWLAVGCASSPPRTSAPASQADVRDSGGEALAAPDAANANEVPGDAIAWVRLGSPKRDLKTIGSYGVVEGDAAAVLQNPELVLLVLVGGELSGIVDADRPVDALFVPREGDEAEVTVAFDLRDRGVLDGDGAPARRRIANGRWLFETEPVPGVLTSRCELWQAPDPLGFRVICGASAERIAAHAPFLLGPRVLGAGPKSVRFEMSGPGYQKILRTALDEQRAEPLTGSEDERRGEELGRRWLERLFGENAALTMEVELGPSDVELTLEMGFRRGQTASNLEAWFGPGAPALGIPESFFRLPKDSHLAFGSAGVAPGTGARAGAALDEFLGTVYEPYEISDADMKEMRSAFIGAMPKDGRFALAFGFEADKARKLVESVRAAEKSGKQPSAAELDRLDAALTGWMLGAVEEPPAVYLEALKRFVKVGEIPAPRKKSSAPGGAAGSGDDAAEEDRTNSHMKIVQKLPAGLPKGSLHIVDEVRPNPKYKPVSGGLPPARPYDVHTFAVPDGERVWLAVARDERIAAERVRAQISRAAGGRLADVPELAELGRKRVALVGAVSIEGIVAQGLDAETAEARAQAFDAFEQLARLPKRGRGMLASWFEVNRNAHEGWSVVTKSRVPVATIRELVPWITAEMKD